MTILVSPQKGSVHEVHSIPGRIAPTTYHLRIPGAWLPSHCGSLMPMLYGKALAQGLGVPPLIDFFIDVICPKHFRYYILFIFIISIISIYIDFFIDII